jgi:hypothetical protein
MYVDMSMMSAGSHLRASSIVVAYSADGCLSVWDCLSRVCLQKVAVLELLGLGGQGGVSVEGKALHYLYHYTTSLLLLSA